MVFGPRPGEFDSVEIGPAKAGPFYVEGLVWECWPLNEIALTVRQRTDNFATTRDNGLTLKTGANVEELVRAVP
jgi:hypothetical protein